MNAERERLVAPLAGRDGWKHWGPYLSERQWGTVREDYSADGERVGLFPARSCPQPRLSLGRGRHRRLLRRRTARVPGAGAVERQRSHPQGAAVRPHQLAGQSRRGRQGAVLLPRRHADALLPEDALQVSAAPHFPTRSWWRKTRGAAPDDRSTSCSTPASSTSDRYFDVFVEYAKAEPGDVLMQITAYNRGPEAARPAPASAALVAQHLVAGSRTRERRRCAPPATRESRQSSRDRHCGDDRALDVRRPAAELLFTRQRNQRAGGCGRPAAPATSRTRFTTTSSTARAAR